MRDMYSGHQEQLLAAITQDMATAHEGAGIVEVRSGSKNLIPGASGFEHQIDVSVHTERELILYECKYWNTNVHPEVVLALAARGTDIQRAYPSKVVSLNIVVRHDLTAGAQHLADAFNIRRHVAKSGAEFSIGYKTDWSAAVVAGAPELEPGRS